MRLRDLTSISAGLLRALGTSVRALNRDPSLSASEPLRFSIRAEPERLRDYCRECGFDYDGFLPATFPHALAAAAHVQVLAAPGFPFPVLGVVHVRNRIHQRRRIEVDESLRFTCRVRGHRVVRTGYEYDLITEVDSGEERLWEEVTTLLVRAKVQNGSRPTLGHEVPPTPDERLAWRVDASQGRRFALASWDFNPIHIASPFAKLFGFDSAIAHGMWMLARCLASVEALDGVDEVQVNAFFLRPLPLPADVECVSSTQGLRSIMAVLRAGDEKPHVVVEANREA